ncbi:MAG: septal ring lytic transglycosylase RlpA family protein [Pseudomonadota bacterium]
MRTFLLSAAIALITALGFTQVAQAKFRVQVDTQPAVTDVAVKKRKKTYTNSRWTKPRKRRAASRSAKRKKARVASKAKRRGIKRKRLARKRRVTKRKRVAKRRVTKRRITKRRVASKKRLRKRTRRVARKVRTRKPQGKIFYSTQRVSVAAYIGKVRRRAPGTVLRGVASFYWQPQPLASGGRFNPNALTAAHKTLPFGTRVRVKNLRNGKTVTVRINDRGPYIKGRIIDLSRRAAGVIGMRARGIAPVTVTVLGR